jgi:ribosomal peptide maturation radical SAM protein 1
VADGPADQFVAKCDRAFGLLGSGCDAVLIVPPFADVHRPAFGVHLLQACAEQAGLRVKILYANILFAALSGEHLYNTISSAPRRWMWGERMFAATAFGLPPLGYETERVGEQIGTWNCDVTFEQLQSLEGQIARFCSEIGARFARLGCPIAGATTNFEQTAASVALLSALKRAQPDVITLIGGANCEGRLTDGMASLGAPIDYIFSGECESVFPAFLHRAVLGEPLPDHRIIRGEACFDMNALPEPDFDDYFAQLANGLPSCLATKQIWLTYESSRGCWWGAHQHCTFCGLNGETMAFRQKSPERVIAGLQRLLLRYPTRLVCMVDNIMPHSFFRTVLPRLAGALPPAHIFYEIKANLNLNQVQLLHQAGVRLIQPGIEALSSSLLQRMKKGVLARQNLALLRYARGVGLAVNWNLLYDFPGDEREDYDSTLRLLPLIHHLTPPAALCKLSIDRFSPYFNEPQMFGITGMKPMPGYDWSFPHSADLSSLAYHFVGDYVSAHRSNPDLLVSMERAHQEWFHLWTGSSAPPMLSLTPVDDHHYLLMDTRGLEDTEGLQFLTEEQARTVLSGGPLEREALASWAIERKLAVALDGWCVPLAVTDVETWRRLAQPASGSDSLLVCVD